MPTFQLERDGRIFEVEAPDREHALLGFQSHAPTMVASDIQQSQQPGGIGERLAKVWESPTPGMFNVIGMAKGAYEAVRTLPQTIAASLPQSSQQGFVPTNPNKDQQRIAAQTQLAGMALGRTPASKPAMTTVEKAVIPSQEEAKAAAKTGYTTAFGEDIKINPRAVTEVNANIMQELDAENFLDITAPQTFAVIDRTLPKGRGATVNEIEAVRQKLGNVSSSPRDMYAASLARQKISEYLSNLAEKDVTGPGDVKLATGALKDARANYAAAMRSEVITDAIATGDLRAASTGKGMNIDNVIRQNIRKIVEKIDNGKLRGWTAEERDALENVVSGGKISNLLRYMGGFAPTSVVAAIPGLVKGHALAAAQMSMFGPKMMSDYITRRRALMADELVRSRSPLAKPAVTERSRRKELLKTATPRVLGYSVLQDKNSQQ